MSQLVRNPVLRGFEPDPSIAVWNGRYVIATSTFEWFPGVRLHISDDLAHWQPAGHVLTTPEQLDLRGVPDSGGIWAPSVSVAHGRLWLVYTVVRTSGAAGKDLDNYLVTADAPEGPWSAPVRLGSRGFDASMFHDDDGRHWLACVRWDPRAGRRRFAGISVQEYDCDRACLVGPARVVLTSDELIEGPNLYRKGDFVYLMVAQGGTGWNHGIAMARSRDVLGPYRADPWPSLLTTRDDPASPLQKAGHGELVRTAEDDWYLVHLASRPVADEQGRFCVTGRETCLQRVTWTDDGWLRVADDEGVPTGGFLPRQDVAVPGEGRSAVVSPDLVEEFGGPELDTRVWSSLRRPATPDWADLTSRPGRLRLRGGQYPGSRFGQSMVATRLKEPWACATTVVEASPADIGQRAGLAVWYDAVGYHYIHVTLDDEGRRVVLVESSTPRGGLVAAGEPHAVPGPGSVHLRFRLEKRTVAMDFGRDGLAWTTVAVLPSRPVSDDCEGLLRFTGAMVALRADDHDGTGLRADFGRTTVAYDCGAGGGATESRTTSSVRRCTGLPGTPS
ncbi:glycoside hydrolase family 43 protein [Kineosporia sp. J2-2]|uniref:Glycoside hydrolase family 43 protein n=1 Tax=Kineosporia corallincola TaxID=2835133 RepID=A0ABS5TRR4_9ACTN|nr:glycoside hydrolase family 43 protein [Kineosporia corallincola]MBT0773492.1 glycoside hydrolase family 43 protein [Kineosporia corallincola]